MFLLANHQKLLLTSLISQDCNQLERQILIFYYEKIQYAIIITALRHLYNTALRHQQLLFQRFLLFE